MRSDVLWQAGTWGLWAKTLCFVRSAKTAHKGAGDDKLLHLELLLPKAKWSQLAQRDSVPALRFVRVPHVRQSYEWCAGYLVSVHVCFLWRLLCPSVLVFLLPCLCHLIWACVCVPA